MLTGYIYTARDAAHKEFMKLLGSGEKLPFDIDGATIYYAGPTEAHGDLAVGACGPTTSSRMDTYAPKLLDLGLCAMIGKGERSEEVKRAIVQNKAVYLCAIGGAGAIACEAIKSCQVVAFEHLGCESVKKLYVKDFPLVVAIDSFGNDIFEQGINQYRE